MADRPLPSLHHVAFCVRAENQDRAADFWRDLGFEFADIDVPDVGLRVLLDWTRGIEILSPVGDAGEENARVRAFLDEHGEGVYAVVVRTADMAGPVAIAGRHGATVEFHQHRQGEGFDLEESTLSTLHGMPVTLLTTDIPD